MKERRYLQPVDDLAVVEFEDELVNNAVDADGAAYELQRGALWVAEDEVVRVEIGQGFAANASCQLKVSKSRVSLLLESKKKRTQKEMIGYARWGCD